MKPARKLAGSRDVEACAAKRPMQQPLPLPHRAYRRLRASRAIWPALLLGLILIPLLLLWALPTLNAWHAAGALALLRWASGEAVPTVSVELGRWTLRGVDFRLAPTTPASLLWSAGVGGAVLALAYFGRALPLWLRQMLGLFAAVTLITALLLSVLPGGTFTGRDLAALATGTQALLWVVLPAIAWAVAATTAVSPLLWPALPLAWLLYDVPFAMLRQAAWAAVLGEVGTPAAPLLYFFTGPLLDILALVGLYGLMLYGTARLAGRRGLPWRWL